MSKYTHQLVDAEGQLAQAVSELERDVSQAEEPRLYLDTEFESNRSGTKMCLFQISAGRTSYLIDPLRLRSLESLRPLLADADVEWILHAGLQDVELICNAVRIKSPPALLDTQVAWALLTAEASVSLAYLQFKLLGIRSEKGHQADDWVRRPLQASQLRYAAADVDYLPEMTEQLLDQAAAKGRMEMLYAASYDSLSPEREPPAPLVLSSFRNAWQLSAKSQAGMLFLIDWYNGLSLSERQGAPENKALLSIAGRLPEDVAALSRIKGVPRGVVNEYGRLLVDGLARAAREANTDDFQPIDPPAYGSFEEIRLEAWLAQYRAELSTSLEFAPDFVLPSRLLKRMKSGLEAEGVSGFLESLVGWRREFLLAESQKFCEQNPPGVTTTPREPAAKNSEATI